MIQRQPICRDLCGGRAIRGRPRAHLVQTSIGFTAQTAADIAARLVGVFSLVNDDVVDCTARAGGNKGRRAAATDAIAEHVTTMNDCSTMSSCKAQRWTFLVNET